MKILIVVMLCAVWCPVFAGPIDSCANSGNMLWDGMRTYKGPSDRAARIESVIHQKAIGLDNVLTVAVWFGYDDIIAKLLKDRDLVNKHGAQSLYLAASMGRLHEMSMLIDAGVAPNSQVQNGFTPIYGAAEHGCVQAMRLLVDSGADVNHDAKVQWTLLEDAAGSRQFSAARFLVENGYNVGEDEKERVKEILRRMGAKSEFGYIFKDAGDGG